VIGAGTLDSLPHNGAVVTPARVCGSTHGKSYFDIVMVGIRRCDPRARRGDRAPAPCSARSERATRDALAPERRENVAKRTWTIIGFTLLSIAAAFLLPAVPQPAAYHDFADRRAGFGIENVLDVVSNGAFLLAGIAGLAVVLRPRTRFEFAAERWPYGLFFLGVLLTAAGSAYYHLAPDNERLFWDRLPITIALMALISAQVVDRVSVRAGLALLGPALLPGPPPPSTGSRRSGRAPATSCPTPVVQGYAV